MNQFYASITFLGVVLIVVSLLWILIDRKKSNEYEKRLDRKKEELSAIISDAEEMIVELNKFSDYIVTQMDLKNEELLVNLKKYDQKLKQITEKSNEEFLAKKASNKKIVNGKTMERDLPVNNAKPMGSYNTNSPQKHFRSQRKEKVVPLNTKYREVLELAKDGLSDTEIAKSLKMGKGEIQLILELNR